MSKLKNIKALGEMLQGTHKRQTNKTFGFSDSQFQSDKNKIREVGEVWEEVDSTGENICWWEQKNGYRIKHYYHPDVASELKKIHEYLNSFPNCQKEVCTCLNPSRLDLKFRKLMGMCEDCLISMETKLKIQGKFNEYAVKKMRANAEAFFKQADTEVEILKEEMMKIKIAGDEHGDPVETWSFQDPESFKKYIDEQYKSFKEKTFAKFEVGGVASE